MRIVLSETGPRREDRVKRITAALLTALLASPSQSLAAQSLASMREVMPVSKDAGFSLVRLDGSEAKQVFMRAISEEALQIARERAAERGLRVTDTFTVYEIRPTAGLRKAQTEIGLEGGRVLVWDWENYDTAYTSGTMIVETWSPSTSTTFDFTYWEDDTWGATRAICGGRRVYGLRSARCVHGWRNSHGGSVRQSRRLRCGVRLWRPAVVPVGGSHDDLAWPVPSRDDTHRRWPDSLSGPDRF